MRHPPVPAKSAFAILFALSAVALVGLPFVGMEPITPARLLDASDVVAREIFTQIRLPRAITAYLAGSCLAVCGLVFQALFRNPLATPYTLGVSSGASLGATIYVTTGLSFTFMGAPGSVPLAFAGAIVSIGLVFGMTRVNRAVSPAGVLLAGVAVNFFFSSLILVLQYVSDFTKTFRILRWLMGGLEVTGYNEPLVMAPFAVIGFLAAFHFGRELDILSTGEVTALSRGVDVPVVKAVLLVTVSLAVGGVVAVCGPIGFVGMMTPHILRLLVGPGHRALVPLSALFGGVFLALCDAFARTIIAPVEIPVGVVTAMLGGPFFFWLLAGSGRGRIVL
jgi:iron complex transport system permease protein